MSKRASCDASVHIFASRDDYEDIRESQMRVKISLGDENGLGDPLLIAMSPSGEADP